MASKLNIINQTFARLGEAIVLVLTGDPAPPNVVKALALWDVALEVALAQAPWLCATDSVRLPVDAAPPEGWGDWRYPSRYTLPGDTLKVWSVENGDAFAWQAGTAIDVNGAMTRIIKAATDGALLVDLCMKRPPEALTPLLADALAWELAARLAGPIQSNEQKAQWAAKQAETAYAKAAGSEATEIGGQDPLFGVSGLTAARWAAG